MITLLRLSRTAWVSIKLFRFDDHGPQNLSKRQIPWKRGKERANSYLISRMSSIEISIRNEYGKRSPKLGRTNGWILEWEIETPNNVSVKGS